MAAEAGLTIDKPAGKPVGKSVAKPIGEPVGKPAPETGGGRSLVWLQGLVCGGLATMAPALALLVGMLLAPGVLAALLDRQPGKPVARCVALCGLAACIAPLRGFWDAGHGMDAATAIIADPLAVGAAWSAAAGGWLLVEATPLLIRLGLEAAGRVQAIRLKAELAQLAKDWTDDAAP